MSELNTPLEGTLEQTAAPTLENVVEDALAHLPIEVYTPWQSGVGLVDYREEHTLKIRALNEEASALPAITAPKERDVNQKMKTRLVGMRNELNRRRLAIFEPVRALKSKVDEYIGTTPDAGLQGQLKAIEDKVSARIDAWDRKVEDERIAAANAIRERNTARAKTLLAMHLTFDGGAYRITHGPNTLTVTDADLRSMDEKAWEALMTGQAAELSKAVQDDIDAQEAAHAAEQKKEAEEHEAMRLRFETQAREQKKMDDDRAALDKEREDMRREKTNSRADQLQEIGIEGHTNEYGLFYAFGDSIHDFDKLADLTAIEWQGVIGDAKEFVAARIERMKLMDERSDVLKTTFPFAKYDGDSVWTLGNASTTDHALATMTEEQWGHVLDEFTEANAAAANVAVVGDRVEMDAYLNEEEPREIIDIVVTTVEKERMRAVLVDAEALLTSLDAAKEATTSAIARQTYERAYESARIVVDNLCGTMNKDL